VPRYFKYKQEPSKKSEWRGVWQGRGKCGSTGEGLRNQMSLALKFASEVSHLPK